MACSIRIWGSRVCHGAYPPWEHLLTWLLKIAQRSPSDPMRCEGWVEMLGRRRPGLPLCACDFYAGARELGKAARWQAWGLGEEKGKAT